jgi:hypothetical protein
VKRCNKSYKGPINSIIKSNSRLLSNANPLIHDNIVHPGTGQYQKQETELQEAVKEDIRDRKEKTETKGRMWKEEALVYLKVLSQHFPEIIVCLKPKFRNPGPAKYETSSLKHSTTMFCNRKRDMI